MCSAPPSCCSVCVTVITVVAVSREHTCTHSRYHSHRHRRLEVGIAGWRLHCKRAVKLRGKHIADYTRCVKSWLPCKCKPLVERPGVRVDHQDSCSAAAKNQIIAKHEPTQQTLQSNLAMMYCTLRSKLHSPLRATTTAPFTCTVTAILGRTVTIARKFHLLIQFTASFWRVSPCDRMPSAWYSG